MEKSNDMTKEEKTEVNKGKIGNEPHEKKIDNNKMLNNYLILIKSFIFKFLNK